MAVVFSRGIVAMSKLAASYFSVHTYTQSKELQSRFPKASLWHDYFTVWMLWREGGRPGGRDAPLFYWRLEAPSFPFYPRAETIYSPSVHRLLVRRRSVFHKREIARSRLSPPLRGERERERSNKPDGRTDGRRASVL